MERIESIIFEHGKIWALLSSFVVVFFLAGLLAMVFTSPFVAAGVVNWNTVISCAIGAGIGAAIPNSIACFLIA